MKIKKLTPRDSAYPDKLRHIPQPPKQFFYLAQNIEPLWERPAVAIVGSRKVSAYGRQVTQKLAGELARLGVVIVSGLALGVDGLAHQAALEAGGLTIAVMPCGLNRIYPAAHHSLAKQILLRGGALVSEYPTDNEPRDFQFVARNRIVSGLARGVLITEAAEKSGSLHTANFALEQGREVFAVPGNITSMLSVGTNNLIKVGATPVTSIEDVLNVLGLEAAHRPPAKILAANEEEHRVLTLLADGVSEADALLKQSKLAPIIFNQTLTMLEISGKVRAAGNGNWTLN
jgi:DNA processing protein